MRIRSTPVAAIAPAARMVLPTTAAIVSSTSSSEASSGSAL